jgi:hypothetical protein
VASYQEDFPVGSLVRIADRETLEHFRTTWRYHNPLTEEQVAFAGREAAVTAVGFYHGGDVLYTLRDVPGVWHEQCLSAS